MIKQYLIFAAAVAAIVLAPIVPAQTPFEADPALLSWIDEVLSENPELLAARAALDAAGGRLRAADRPLYNPTLQFDYEDSEAETRTGGIGQTIDWADKRGARAAVADSELEGVGAELQTIRQRLATDLLLALADWHTGDAVVKVTEQQIALMARFIRLAERRRKAGDLGQVELDLAHLAAANVAFQRANAIEELFRARQAVTALTGDGAPGWPAFTEQLPEIDPQPADVERWLDELPVMRVALARMAAARALVQLRIREKRPDPTIGFRMGKEDSETLAGVTLSVPLFVRNTFSAQVDVANAELIQVESEAANLRRLARADMVAAARIYANGRRAWRTWQASGAPRLSHRTELLERLWQAGELDTTDYVVQLTQSLDTAVSAIGQRGRMWRAWSAWLNATGQIGRWLNLTGEN